MHAKGHMCASVHLLVDFNEVLDIFKDKNHQKFSYRGV